MDPSTDGVQHWVPTMTACSPHSGLTNAPSSSPSWLVLKPDESADDGTFFFFFFDSKCEFTFSGGWNLSFSNLGSREAGTSRLWHYDDIFVAFCSGRLVFGVMSGAIF